MADDLVQKTVVAIIDERTTLICLHAAGQIVPADQPFQTIAGPMMRPPFHEHCRSISVPVLGQGAGEPAAQSRHADSELGRRGPKAERQLASQARWALSFRQTNSTTEVTTLPVS